MLREFVVVQGILCPVERTPLLAAALRLYAQMNGGLPSWADEVLSEWQAVANGAMTSSAEVAEVPQRASARRLSGVTLGTKLAAAELGTTDRNVRDLCHRGSIESVVVGGRHVITRHALDAYKARRAS